MSVKVYKIESEWDIGQGGFVFTSGEGAWASAKKLYNEQGFEAPFDEMVSMNLIGVSSLDLVS